MSFMRRRKITYILWYLKVHYRVHNNPVSQANKSSPHVIPHFSTISSNIILLLTVNYTKRSILQEYCVKILIHISFIPCMLHAPRIFLFIFTIIMNIIVAITSNRTAIARCVHTKIRKGKFIPVQDKKRYGGVEVWFHLFLISALDGIEWYFTPRTL
jgi:hypothetical protein